MKTKMIPGLSMLAFNDINKPHRKFHLHYVICSAPQVAREASDIEGGERGTGNEKGGGVGGRGGGVQKFECENVFTL